MSENGSYHLGSESELLARLKTPMAGADVLPLLRLSISRSWWGAARELVAQEHARTGDVSHAPGMQAVQTEVTNLLAEVKHSADALAAFAEETYRSQTKGLTTVHCAVQWAQNSTDVFLGVKYAARWSAPGAIEIADLKVNITAPHFALEGFGHHSGIRKRYLVSLPLYKSLVPKLSHWSAASVGRMTATLRKASVAKWPRLTEHKGKGEHPITSWLDMEEKWADELRKHTEKPKKEEKKGKKDGKKDSKAKKESQSKESKPSATAWRKAWYKNWKLVRNWMKKHLVGTTACATAVVVICIFFLKSQGGGTTKVAAAATFDATAASAFREARATAALARAEEGDTA